MDKIENFKDIIIDINLKSISVIPNIIKIEETDEEYQQNTYVFTIYYKVNPWVRPDDYQVPFIAGSKKNYSRPLSSYEQYFATDLINAYIFKINYEDFDKLGINARMRSEINNHRTKNYAFKKDCFGKNCIYLTYTYPYLHV
jgi:hypothetical protein